MTFTTLHKTSRLDVVDALRGLALFAIVILHNLEHYNLYYIPQDFPQWLTALDKWTWDAIFFLMAGKAYAMFSLLFGFSFYIQYANEQKRGGDFRLRFAWRLFLLFLFSQLHALFYNGDILFLYSIVGLVLIPTCRLKDKALFILALVLLLQPFEWGRIIYILINPDYTPKGDYFVEYANLTYPVMQEGSYVEVLKSNIWHGQLFCNIWQAENGRLFQIAALFMFGMLLGRRKLFVKSDQSTSDWKKMLKIAIAVFIPLYLFNIFALDSIENKSLLVPMNIVFRSLANFALMLTIVAGFTLLWFKYDGRKWQKIFIPYGRMSLTNYISQSILGVAIYYGFGLSLYKYTGATLSMLIGICIFGIQLLFSRWWLSHHTQGPLEFIWRKGTWINHKR